MKTKLDLINRHSEIQNPNSICCPNCGADIALTEAVSHGIREQLKQEFDAKLQLREKEFARQQKQLADAQAALEQAQTNFDVQIQHKLAAEKPKLLEQAREQVRQSCATELQDLQSQLRDQKAQLTKAQEAELALRKEKRQLQADRETLQLELERKLDEQRAHIRKEAAQQAAESHRLQLAQQEQHIADLKDQIAILKQKSEQGSQQAQGEVLETELEDELQAAFPHDEIIPINKGQRGADVLQKVRTPSGHECGAILWEAKRARNWSPAWIAKLKEDQRDNGADLAVIVTTTLPGEVKRFALHEGVWVTELPCVIGVAAALRHGLIATAHARRADTGRQSKADTLYTYLTSIEFRQIFDALVDAFAGLKRDLDAERRAAERQWAKREKQLQIAATATVTLYGNLQGIVGENLLPELPSLALTPETSGLLPLPAPASSGEENAPGQPDP